MQLNPPVPAVGPGIGPLPFIPAWAGWAAGFGAALGAPPPGPRFKQVKIALMLGAGGPLPLAIMARVLLSFVSIQHAVYVFAGPGVPLPAWFPIAVFAGSFFMLWMPPFTPVPVPLVGCLYQALNAGRWVGGARACQCMARAGGRAHARAMHLRGLLHLRPACGACALAGT